MAEGICVRLDVALQRSGDSIRGTVDDHAGDIVAFSGWLELMSALDIVCSRAGGPPPREARSLLDDGR